MLIRDIIVEEIVKKKKTLKDKMTMLGVVAACVFLVVFLYKVILPIVPQLASIVFMLVALSVYFTYILAQNFNLEYEYALVNYDLDIDKIASKKYRKKVTSVDLKNLEAFGTRNLPEFEKNFNDKSIKKVYACYDEKDENPYFLVYTENLEKKMLIFSPGGEMVEGIKTLIARRAKL